MLGSVFALVLALGKRVCLGVQKGHFVLFTYIGLALDRRMVQSSNLVLLESDVGPLNECSCASVCLSICL